MPSTLTSSTYVGAVLVSDAALPVCSFPVSDCPCTADSHSFVNVASGNLTAFTYDISWLQVKNFCGVEEEEKLVKITATIETVRALLSCTAWPLHLAQGLSFSLLKIVLSSELQSLGYVQVA